MIAARTYALFQMKEMRKDKGRVFDVESTQKDQVYLGMDRADSKGSQIVASTRGMILTAKNSSKLDPIKAFYHASCGGSTVLPQKVWGARFAGFTQKAVCPYCSNSPSYHWEYRTSLGELEEHIQKGVRVDSTNRKLWPARYVKNPAEWILTQIKSVASDDQRVQNLTFEFNSRTHAGLNLSVNMNAYQGRNWFDPVKMKSTLFSLEQKGSSVVFKGKGSGHGVGMCQWGAKHMGEIGYTAEQILALYYPGVKVARLWK